MFVLSEPAFRCEEAAYEYIESKVWPNGPVCPHCDGRDRIGRLRGQSTKVGTYKCYSCRKPFNVKIGTMLESTHVPLHMWLQALFLLQTCKPGISIHRLHHVLGVSSRTTWLMAQRVRTALAKNSEALLDADGVAAETSDIGIQEFEHDEADSTLASCNRRARRFRVQAQRREPVMSIGG
jgi:transposase-like protein